MPKTYLLSGGFWVGAVERSVKTFAQTLSAAAGLGDPGVSVVAVGWRDALGIAGAAALGSMLLSLASGPIGPSGSPSLVEDRSVS